MQTAIRACSAAALLAGLVVILTGCGRGDGSDRVTKIESSSGTGSRAFEMRGSIEFTDDDRDVRSISPGGYLRIEDKLWLRTRRSYEIKADPDGSLSRVYRVDGRDRPIDESANAWLAAALLTLMRENGLDASRRVDRLAKDGGPEAVLREVAQIRSDRSKRIYLSELVERERLTENQLRDVMRSARKIGSDGEKAAFLMDVSRSYLRTGVEESWFSLVGEVGSDGDKRGTLQHAIETDGAEATLALAAKAAESIGSDGDKAAVLSAISEKSDGKLSEPVRPAWFRAVRTIGSDGDKARVLSALLSSPQLDDEVMVEAWRAAETIGSDGDKTQLLSRAIHFEMKAEAARTAFFSAVKTIGSDGDRATVLRNLLEQPGLSPATAVAAIDTATTIGSDGDKASVFVIAAERHGSDSTIRASLERALKSVGSDGDYRRVSEVLRR